MPRRRCRIQRRIASLVLAAGILLNGLPCLAADPPTGAQVRNAIANGVRYLRQRQQLDGRWPEQHFPGGESCLATLALLQAGEPPDAPHLAAALEQIESLPNAHTYVVSLKIQVLALADAQAYRVPILAAARWLIDAQHADGLWSYTAQPAPFDHSNSQFALLGLHAAAEAGVNVPRSVWQSAQTRVLSTQNPDGGWTYKLNDDSYGSMTAANACNLYLLGSRQAISAEKGFRNGVAPNCGKYTASRPLLNGLRWLAANFTAAENPGRGGNYLYYWLYAVERCGIHSGLRRFGEHDWYREGAEFLIKAQRPNGSWGSLVDTSFAVLFLSKGRKPILVQKLQWSRDDAWNPDRHDAENLVAFVGDRLGEPTSWQTVAFDAPLEDWLAAPLLYMQGHIFPGWNEAQRSKIKAYIEQGGTLLAEACCGRSEFREGFEALIGAMFPQQPLRELDPGHPVYTALFPLPPQGLMGVDVGCRTSVLYSPRDLSCLWEQRNLPDLSEPALQLGANIAAFAAGRRGLRDRLDVVALPSDAAAGLAPPPGGALRLAQVVYEGDWRPDPDVLNKLAELLHERAGVDVATPYRPLRLTDADRKDYPILFMTGHYAFTLAPEECAALAEHLRRGGFLLIEACCGRAAFDEAARQLLPTLVPGGQWKRLPADHPVLHAGGAADRGSMDVQAARALEGARGGATRGPPRIAYKPTVANEQPDLNEPVLWGLWIDGRLAAVYSPFALGCGVDGHSCPNCRGVADADAQRLMAGVVLYAMTN